MIDLAVPIALTMLGLAWVYGLRYLRAWRRRPAEEEVRAALTRAIWDIALEARTSEPSIIAEGLIERGWVR